MRRILEAVYFFASPWINRVLRPFGLIMAGEFYCAGELPTPDDPFRLVGVSFGLRPKGLSKAIALHKSGLSRRL